MTLTDRIREALEAEGYLSHHDTAALDALLQPLLDAHEAAHAEALRQKDEELAHINARFCANHQGRWSSTGCLACSVIHHGDRQHQLLAAKDAEIARLKIPPA